MRPLTLAERTVLAVGDEPPDGGVLGGRVSSRKSLTPGSELAAGRRPFPWLIDRSLLNPAPPFYRCRWGKAVSLPTLSSVVTQVLSDISPSKTGEVVCS